MDHIDTDASDMNKKNESKKNNKNYCLTGTDAKGVNNSPQDKKDVLDAVIEDYCGDDEKCKFEERRYLQIDGKFEYERKGKYAGYVIIFNMEKFNEKGLSRRRGTRKDVNDIIDTFIRIGYNINENHIYNDLSAAETLNSLDKVLNKDLTEFNSIITFFLSHGSSKGTLETSQGELKTNDIIIKILECKQFKNKPKMFVFQTCKGHKTASPSSAVRDVSTIVPEKTFLEKYISQPDMIILYASVEGYRTHRNILFGTWLIQELCKNITSYGRREDVTSIITRTTKCVSSYYFDENGSQISKQVPLFISTLRKKFYLCNSKERSFLVELVKKNDETAKIVEDLKKRLL